MSNFALQFIPSIDPRDMTPAQRIEAARNGTLPEPDENSTQYADREALRNMGVQAETGMRDQTMSGVNEGIAQFLGFPVDTVTSGVNAASSAINNVTGSNIPPIENPLYGSEMISDLMDPVISDMPPQTTAQRYGRRVGQEVGFGVPASATMAGLPGKLGQMARTNLPAYMGGGAASDTVAGIAGQTSREIAPNSAIADFLASSLAGVGAAAGMSRASKSRPDAPTRAEIETRTNDLYDQTKGVTLTDQASQEYLDRVKNRMTAEGGDAYSHPKAAAQVRRIENNPRPDIYGVEQSRRKIRDNVARNADESPMGSALVKEVDDYLSTLTPNDVMSGDPESAVDALRRARASAHTGIKYDEVMDGLDEARRRTEGAGTAGNTLNNATQEVGKLYKKEVSRRKPQLSGGYTPDEIAAMERIVFPSKTERTLQRIGRFSPSTGALQSMAATAGGGAGVTAGLMSGNPAYYAAAVPPVAGVLAQSAAERMKNRNIAELLDTIQRGGVAVPKQASPALRAALIAQLMKSGAQ